MTDPFGISVVMPVYHAVRPEYLRRAVESIYDQTLSPQEIILVEDGPLTTEHHDVLHEYAGRRPPLRRVVLSENLGAGPANQAGVEAALFPWIAKMDADDIALPRRFERQIELLRGGNLDLVGGSMLEFVGPETNVVGTRRMPQHHDAIVRYAKMNNPVNHPSVMYRRAVALRVGGYRSLPYLEDYDLIARMLGAGARMQNLPDVLMLFRSGEATFARRRARGMLMAEFRLQRNLRTYGLINRRRAGFNIVARSLYRWLPQRFMAYTYERMFYRKAVTGSRH